VEFPSDDQRNRNLRSKDSTPPSDDREPVRQNLEKLLSEMMKDPEVVIIKLDGKDPRGF
jgi:hypothetical protein